MTRSDAHTAPSLVLILLLGLLSASAPLAIDMYLPAMPTIAGDLSISVSRVQQTLSIFMLGFSACQLVYGPLSDRYGRKPIILGGLALYLISSLFCASASSIEALQGWRLMQALGAGAASVVVSAVVRDLWQGEQAARIMSLVMMSMTVAPLLAPLLGAQILFWWGWQAIFTVLAIIALIQLLLVCWKLPETLAPQQQPPLAVSSLLHSYLLVLRHREAMGNLLCSSFSFAGMFAFIAGSPFVYIEYYGVPARYYGLLFGSNILVMILLNWLNSRLITGTGLQPMIRIATLIQALAGLALLAAAVTGVGELWTLVPGIVIFVGVIGLIGANTTAGVITPFKRSAGTASALLGAVRFLIGALAAALLGWLHNGTPAPMAAVMCSCGLLAFFSYRMLVSSAKSAEI